MISASLRSNNSISTINSIKNYCLDWIFFENLTVDIKVGLNLACEWLLLKLSFGPDGSVKQVDMRNNIIKHVGKIFNVILVSENLFRS